MAIDQTTYPPSVLPGLDAAAIVTSDVTDFTYANRGIYVGVSGDIVAVMLSGAVVTLKNSVQGSVIPIRVKRINATGTTATNLVALY